MIGLQGPGGVMSGGLGDFQRADLPLTQEEFDNRFGRGGARPGPTPTFGHYYLYLDFLSPRQPLPDDFPPLRPPTNVLVWHKDHVTAVDAQAVAEGQLTRWYVAGRKPSWWPYSVPYPLPADWCVRARVEKVVGTRWPSKQPIFEEVWKRTQCGPIPQTPAVVSWGHPTQQFSRSASASAPRTVRALYGSPGAVGVGAPRMATATVRPIAPQLTVPLQVTIGNRMVVYDGTVTKTAWNQALAIVALAKANPREVPDGWAGLLFPTGLVNRRFVIVDDPEHKPVVILKGTRLRIVSGSQKVEVPLNVLADVAQALGFFLLAGVSIWPEADVDYLDK